MTASAAPGKVPELNSSSMKEMVCLNSFRFFILEPANRCLALSILFRLRRIG